MNNRSIMVSTLLMLVIAVATAATAYAESVVRELPDEPGAGEPVTVRLTQEGIYFNTSIVSEILPDGFEYMHGSYTGNYLPTYYTNNNTLVMALAGDDEITETYTVIAGTFEQIVNAKFNGTYSYINETLAILGGPVTGDDTLTPPHVGTPSISIIPPSQEVSAGDTYTVNITVDPNATAIQGAQADLIFDPNFVTVDGLSNVGEIFEGHDTYGEHLYVIDNVNGIVSTITSGIIDGGNVTSAGVLATVTLTVNGSATGDSALELINTQVVADVDGGTPVSPPDLVVNNGTLIGPRPAISIIPPSDTVLAGGIFTINITVDPNTTAIQGAQADLIFDPNFVTVDSLSNVGEIFEGHDTYGEHLYVIDNVNGIVSTITSGIIDGGNVTSAGVLATVTLTVNGSATGNFTLNLTSTEVIADGGTPLRPPDIHVNNGTFTIRLDDEAPVINSVSLDRTEVTDGDPILVTVNATDNFGVTSVTAEGVALTPMGGNIWEGIIIVVTGNDVVVNVSARDDADNIGWNNSTSYTARWIREDVYPDGEITIADIVRVGNRFGETGEPGWIPEDVYPDGEITIADIVRVGNRFGETRL